MSFLKQICFFTSFLFLITSCGTRELPQSDLIRISQLGFYPQEEKIAVHIGDIQGQEFVVRNIDNNAVVYSSVASSARGSAFSDKRTCLLDFSSVTIPGEYRIELPGVCKSIDFEIRHAVLDGVAKAAVKAFYYQRTAMTIEPEYAGRWSRELAHIDDQVVVHPSAASKNRPAGSILSSSKGWYDAGDYNKYIVNSAFTVAVLLSLYEDYPDQVKSLNVHIPESKNTTPDLLDEVHWNLDWMLTMQDEEDGGVYHKLTNPEFEGFIKPVDCKKTRYVVAKSVTATLDFAASMAQASRVFRPFEADYPGFSDKALAASRAAFAWAISHPDVLYKQRDLNEIYKPEIITGEYGDKSADDEFFWAAAELYISTGEKNYLEVLRKYMPAEFELPVWGRVAALGSLSLIRNQAQLASNETEPLIEQLKQSLLTYADQRIQHVLESSYYASYGMESTDFFWGCNSDAASSQGMIFLYAWKMTNNRIYLVNALRNMEYILGRNATGYCYITGFGTKSPQHPHHRLAASDDIDEPIPGFLVGGPNPGKQDGCDYPSDIPDECYVDIVASYASNEIAINWQGLFSYFASALSYNLE